MKKFWLKLSTILMAAVCVFVCVACGENTVAEDQNLKVFIANHGYRTEGIKAMVNTFAEQSWVKEKYPELTIDFADNSDWTYVSNKISNPKTNEYDLIFDCKSLTQFFDKNGKGEYLLEDLTESVYNTEVIGESGVKFSDKMDPMILKDRAYTSKTDSTPKYFDVSWVTGMMGLVYNEEILAKFGYTDGKTPNTTNELIALCDAIKANPEKSGNAKGYAHENFSSYTSSIDAWWAQYDGYEAYENFWQGKYKDGRGTTYSNKIFELEGRLKALEVMNELFKYDNGYYDVEGHATGDYMQRQTNFLKGQYAFAFCADWFDIEMNATYKLLEQENITPATVKIMRWPVVSAIIDKLDTVKTDELLSKVIAAIDEGKTSYEGVSDVDFARLVEARGIYTRAGVGHAAVVPSCANSKKISIDFLRFMATDICQEAYMKETRGQNLPFKYNIDTSSDLYKGFSPLQQARLLYYYSNNTLVLSDTSKSALVRYGSLQAVKSQTTAYGDIFYVKGNEITPQRLFDDTKEAWTEDVFNFALQTAGLA